MSQYFRLTQSMDSRYTTFDYPVDGSGKMPALALFTSGKPVDSSSWNLKQYALGEIPDVSMICDAVPVLSDRAADLLIEKVPNEIQLVRCSIDGYPDMYLVNVLNVLDCLDRSQSVAEFYGVMKYPLKHLTNHVKTGINLFLRKSVFGEKAVFRLNLDPISVVLSDSIFCLFEKHNFTGFKRDRLPKYTIVS